MHLYTPTYLCRNIYFKGIRLQLTVGLSNLKSTGQGGHTRDPGKSWLCSSSPKGNWRQILHFFFFFWRTHAFLLRRSTDWMRPITYEIIYLKVYWCACYSHPENTFTTTSRLVFDFKLDTRSQENWHRKSTTTLFLPGSWLHPASPSSFSKKKKKKKNRVCQRIMFSDWEPKGLYTVSCLFIFCAICTVSVSFG